MQNGVRVQVPYWTPSAHLPGAERAFGIVHRTMPVYRGVAQLVAHVLWEHGVAGSNPVTSTRLKIKKNAYPRVKIG